MGTAKTRIWFIPTSPRSPSKIRNELALLSRFDNQDWWARDAQGNLLHQLEYARLLDESDFYEGSISEEYPEFAARDRLRAPQTLGFAYIDEHSILHITPAGWDLINGKRIETLFLKQMLKLQFPSWQHGGNPKTRNRYPVKQMGVFPFIETLRIVQDVGGVSKEELAIFILPTLSPGKTQEAIEKIRRFRKEKSSVTAGRERAEFVDEVHRHTFYEVYKEDIEAGNINTREIATHTVEEFVRKKMRNSRDYADACFRYFQYTGVFSRNEERLIISPTRAVHVKRILDELQFSLRPCDNVINFYAELGNPALPVLPWENTPDLKAEVAKMRSGIEKAIEELKVKLPTVPTPVIKPEPVPTLDNLMEYSYELRLQYRDTRVQLLSVDLATPDGFQQILDTYQRVIRKDIVEPPLFMEWNTWRAFLSLDYFKLLKPNFELDDNLMPISVAGGRKADMEVYYYSDYVLLSEVTLSYGERQYYTEAEPVTRHIAQFQAKELTRGGRKVFGLFIAPRIHTNTIKHFHLHLKHDLTPEAGGRITIIPLNLQDFIEFISFCIINGAFTDASFRELLDCIEGNGIALADNQAEQWKDKIAICIRDWKTQRLQEIKK